MEKIILVAYFKADGVISKSIANGYLETYKGILKEHGCENDVIILPMLYDGEPKIECVHPTCVSWDEYREMVCHANNVLKDIIKDNASYKGEKEPDIESEE